MTSSSSLSLWHHEAAGSEGSDSRPLHGEDRTNVAIVGGGYVGLWTAYWIKRATPDVDVVVIDQGRCGDGASGRNGGFALTLWAKLPSLIGVLGSDRAVEVGRQSEQAITDIESFCEEHDVDAHFVRGGWLWTARVKAHHGAWNGLLEACDRAGVNPFKALPDEEVARRAGSKTHLGGVIGASGATVQPYLLARGLRRVCLELGVRIYEHSKMVGLDRGTPARIDTPGGSITADAVVIATNAWAANMRELKRRLVVVSSDLVATPPIPRRLEEIGWTGGESINDSQLWIDYYRTTRDGRIVFGKGVASLAYGGRIGPSFDRSAARAAVTAADFRAAYPQLADVPLEFDWSGPIDRSPTGLPELGRLGGRPNIFYGVGWSGNGVAPSVLGGRILASLATNRDDEYSNHPLIGLQLGSLPAEPIRFIGGNLVRRAAYHKEKAEMAGRRPNRIAEILSRLVPAGVEDH
ncbi:FAD-binding oxidoreductase [Streptomyces sp. NBC_00878]|uniref:NAD(P)/FAD-dependent oxidoreductase n=1 Tax=Streptomyces sp. NBC_00878 TaxID=2975854 RepID=UPI00224F4899|nr:FAD-binding oxidoreductase [Streptomyces sp. NBC_00878]MCX4910765.1 FAD-binding oxidoreductase [Streptomyces sp. NBC_00878]